MVRDWKALIALLQDGVPAASGSQSGETRTAAPEPPADGAAAAAADAETATEPAAAPADPFAA